MKSIVETGSKEIIRRNISGDNAACDTNKTREKNKNKQNDV